MTETVFFYLIATVLVASSLMVVTLRNIFNAAVFLGCALASVAGLFVLLGADFLAAVQILLYVGGVLVILIFGVMLSSVYRSKEQMQTNSQRVPAIIASLVVLGCLVFAFLRDPFLGDSGNHIPSTQGMGELLLGKMALPFEVLSLILLASLAGAVIFSKRDKKEGGV